MTQESPQESTSPIKIVISLPVLLYGLFIHPHRLFPLLAFDRSFRPFVLFSVFFAITSLIMTAFLYRPSLDGAMKEAERLSSLLGDISYVEEEQPYLEFSKVKTYPLHYKSTFYPYEFVLEAPGTEFVLPKDIEAGHVLLWGNGSRFLVTDGSQVVGYDDKLFPLFGSLLPTTLSQEMSLNLICKQLRLWVPVGILLAMSGQYILLLSLGFISGMVGLVAFGQFRRSWNFFFYGGIPAMVPSAVYTLVLGKGIGDFSHLFIWSGAFYLIVVMISMRSAMMASSK